MQRTISSGATIRLAVMTLTMVSVTVTTAAPIVETVALTGDSAPGGPAGALFLEFGLSQLNDHGEVAFVAAMEPGVGGVTTDDLLGIWKSSAGQIIPATVGDPPAPGVPGGVFENLISAAQFSNSGAVMAAFEMETGPGGVNSNSDEGLWLFDDAGDELLYREGSSLPGMPAGAELFFGSPTINGPGNVMLYARFRDGVGGVTADDDSGLWIKTQTGVDLIARIGSPVAGATNGAVLDGVGSTAFNNNNVIASRFMLREGVAGITEENSEGIYTNRTGILTLEYRKGDVTGGSDVFESFPRVALNNSNRMAFHATLKTAYSVFSEEGIYVESDGGLRKLVQTGDPMPGFDGREFRGFSNLIINDSGQVAFSATSSSPFGFNTIYAEGIDGNLTLLAKDSAVAPGAGADVRFDLNLNKYISIPELHFNTAGQAAFTAGLSGPDISEANDFGLWAQDPQGVLKLVVREGDSVEVAPGDSRVVTTFNFGGMNDEGDIVFDAIFSDGTSGVFLANLTTAMQPGDFDHDGDVDGADFLAIQRHDPGLLPTWRSEYGSASLTTSPFSAETIPEPNSLLLLLSSVGFACRMKKG